MAQVQPATVPKLVVTAHALGEKACNIAVYIPLAYCSEAGLA